MTEPTNPQPDFQKEVNQFVEGAAGLLKSLSDVFLKSREEVVRGAKVGRARLDLFQLKKDRQDFISRLGEDCLRLLERGEVRHPDLEAGWQRIRAVDEKVVQYERDVAALAAEQQAQREANAAGSPASGLDSAVFAPAPAAATPQAATPASPEPAAPFAAAPGTSDGDSTAAETPVVSAAAEAPVKPKRGRKKL
jgi:hypothetical protein